MDFKTRQYSQFLQVGHTHKHLPFMVSSVMDRQSRGISPYFELTDFPPENTNNDKVKLMNCD